ncbi:MAG: hypothetical protein KJ767_00180 [Nanoarchaeota archaeon]|nr:hypothetical protein [Nanoarchaeota archaeon]
MLEEKVSDIEVTNEDGFITQVIKKCQQYYKTSWKMTIPSYPMLGVASKRNPGVAKYILSEINPQPEQVITTKDILRIAPLGIDASDPKFVSWWDGYIDGKEKGMENDCPEDIVFQR